MFLRSGSSTVIIFMHILISTIGAFMVMALLGRSLNVPALGGLAFAVGMLVDNAIVMLENIFRRHQHGRKPGGSRGQRRRRSLGALLNATLANLAVFIPVLFIREEAGQLFRDIAIAISAAVALSMLVAVAVVPTAAMRILQTQPTAEHRPATATRIASHCGHAVTAQPLGTALGTSDPHQLPRRLPTPSPLGWSAC